MPRTYRQEVLRRVRNVSGISKAELKGIVKLLKQAQRQVALRILDMPDTEWTAARIGVLRERMARTMVQVNAQLTGDLAAITERSWRGGAGSIDALLAQFAGERALVGIEPSLAGLAELQAFAADQITEVSTAVIDKVSKEVRMAMIGGQSQADAVKRIGTALVDEWGNPLPGVWGSTARRAEVIYRTESQRALNQGQYRRMQQTERAHPDSLKVWIHAGAGNMKEPRETHLQAEIDYSPGGEPGPIPVSEDFIIADVYAASAPVDPKLPAEEAINCHCTTSIWFPEMEGVVDFGDPAEDEFDDEAA